jgi:uncharacterized membrane protein YjjP (DUF1212 family)
MNPAQDRGVRKASRDIVQALVAVVGAGGAYALIDLIVGSVNPAYGIMLAFFFKILVTYAQNYLETKGKIPVLLPSPGLLTTEAGGALGMVVGTVDTVADTSTSVVGEVLDVTGGVVGGIAGAVGSLKGV